MDVPVSVKHWFLVIRKIGIFAVLLDAGFGTFFWIRNQLFLIRQNKQIIFLLGNVPVPLALHTGLIFD